MSYLCKLKLTVLALIELVLFALFSAYLSSAFGNVLGIIATLVGIVLILTILLFWKLRRPLIPEAVIQKSSLLMALSFYLGIAGFLFPLALGPHATFGALLLGLVAQIACLGVALILL